MQTALIERMETQHGQLSAVLDDIHAALPGFTGTAAPDVRDRLADALRRAAAVLEERRQFLAHLPLVARLLWRFGGRREYAAYVAALRPPDRNVRARPCAHLDGSRA